jgi:hypothetical protein
MSAESEYPKSVFEFFKFFEFCPLQTWYSGANSPFLYTATLARNSDCEMRQFSKMLAKMIGKLYVYGKERK